MEHQSFDFESSLKSIETFVQVVVLGQDENKKIMLKKKLQHFLQITNNPSNITEKDIQISIWRFHKRKSKLPVKKN